MTPVVQTAEYHLLTVLRDDVDVPVDRLNRLALDKALSDGYAALNVSGDFAHITDDGYDRLDELEDN